MFFRSVARRKLWFRDLRTSWKEQRMWGQIRSKSECLGIGLGSAYLIPPYHAPSTSSPTLLLYSPSLAQMLATTVLEACRAHTRLQLRPAASLSRLYATASGGRPLIGRYNHVPVELARVQSGRNVRLRDYETQKALKRFSYDLKLVDGSVRVADGPNFIGASKFSRVAGRVADVGGRGARAGDADADLKVRMGAR